jgi:phospholipase A1/A2
MRFIMCCLFILILMINRSINAEEQIETPAGDETTVFTIPSISEIIDYNISNNAEKGFSPHKENYILPITIADYRNDRENKEIKFQISIKQRLIRLYGWAAYFAYTQKSFWQAYDKNKSFPFRENNFNPEFFIRTKMWSGIRYDLGIEHESNGQKMPDSRSWNRIYLLPYYENNYLISSLKIWYRLKEDKKKIIWIMKAMITRILPDTTGMEN